MVRNTRYELILFDNLNPAIPQSPVTYRTQALPASCCDDESPKRGGVSEAGGVFNPLIHS